MDFTGKIINAQEKRTGTSQRSGNAWASQEFVLEYIDGNSQYPRHLAFRVFGEDRLKQFNLEVGQTVTVSVDVDAHEYNGRWFTDINAWRVTAPQEGAAPAPTQAPAPASPVPAPTDPLAAPAAPAGGEAVDDLPF